MTKSDKLLRKFDSINELLQSAQVRLQGLPIEFVDQSVCVSLFDKIGEVIDELDELTYESVGPLQADEDDKLGEIERLEKRIAELKSSME